MRHIRIFISSPGDVSSEREAARRAIERLGREFPYHFQLDPIVWEREPLRATEHFQAGLPPPRETDIAVVILWRRLGTILPTDEYTGALSGGPVTGTEWEFEDAAAAARRSERPHLLVYRKTAPAMVALDDDAALEELRWQKKRVDEFFQRWFAGAEGTIRAAYHAFRDEVEFAEKIYVHLRAILSQQLEPGAGNNLPPARRWTEGSPFRGLESFELKHAPIFFGRARAQLALRKSLSDRAASGNAFVLVFGASGSGKSSLVKAGLLADLATPGMFGRLAVCRVAIMRPSEAEGGDAVAALARAVFHPAALPGLAPQFDGASLARFLALTATDPVQVRAILGAALGELSRTAKLTETAEARLVLVVDQLEELFTGKDFGTEAREAFVAVLDTLARSGVCLVVATMRSDFFPALEEVPALAALSEGDGRFLLTPPTETELAQIIERPAEEAGLAFEQATATGISLADRIRQTARKGRDALPLLEYLLDQLWQRRTPTGLLTHAAYEELKGLEGAIGARAEQVSVSLPPEAAAALPRLLRGLIQLDADGIATARRLPLADLPEGGPERALAQALAASDARLLVTQRDAGAHARPNLRLAHEALLTHWHAARRVIEEDRAFLLARGRAEQAAADWRRDGEPEDRLLSRRTRALVEAEELLARRAELSAETTHFIERSLLAAAAAEHRQSRMRRFVMAGLTALTVAAVASTGYAVWQKQRADEASERATFAANYYKMESDRRATDPPTSRTEPPSPRAPVPPPPLAEKSPAPPAGPPAPADKPESISPAAMERARALRTKADVLWSRTYGFGEMRSAVMRQDGLIAIAGSITINGRDDRVATLAWLSTGGERTAVRQWRGAVQGDISRLVVFRDGNLAFAGRVKRSGSGFFDAWVVRLTASGRDAWVSHFPEEVNNHVDEAFDLAALDGGHLLFVGQTTRDDPLGDGWAIMVDPNGKKLWELPYGKKDRIEELRKLSVLSDATFVAVGTVKEPAGRERLWLLHFDRQGRVLHETVFEDDQGRSRPTDMQVVGDDVIIAGLTQPANDSEGTAVRWLRKVNAKGGRIWEATISGDGTERIWRMLPLNDGGFVLIVSKSRNSRAKPRVVRVDQAGKPIWDREIERTGLLRDAVALPQGGIVAFGVSTDQKTDNEAWAVRLGYKE